MEYNFLIKDDGSMPIVLIDDLHLSVVHLTYAWSTKTDEVLSGSNICIADGYINNDTTLRRFIFDIRTGEAKEVSLNTSLDRNKGRVFEVCTTRGESYDSEVWEATPFEKLKAGDIIRILDNGMYCRGLDGCGVWVVVDTIGMENGLLNVQPLALPDNREVGRGGFLPGIVKPD